MTPPNKAKHKPAKTPRASVVAPSGSLAATGADPILPAVGGLLIALGLGLGPLTRLRRRRAAS